MLVQSFACPTCGAPKEVVPDTLVVYCDHCGGLVVHDTSRSTESVQQQFVAPTAAQARKQRIFADMQDVKRAGNRSAYRALLAETLAIDLATNPQASGIPIGDPEKTRRWMAASVAMGDLVAFDPEAPARFETVTRASSAMCQPAGRDPVELARAVLAAWRAYYDWVGSRLVEHAWVIQAEPLAQSALRASLRAAELLLGEGVVARIRHEVLGDAIRHVCKSCGAMLETTDVGACRFCGAVVRVETDDPWVTGVTAQWTPTEDRLVREGKLDALDAPLAAIQITLFSLSAGTGTVTAEAAHRMFARLIPWVPKSRLFEAMKLVEGAMVPAARDVLQRVRPMIEASWHVDPSKRPVAKAPIAAPAPHANPDEDPWIQQQIANLRLAAPNGASVLQIVGVCLTPFHMGSQISPAQAIGLFDRVTPKPTRSEIRECVRGMRPGYVDNPAIGQFLDALIRTL